MAKQTEQAADSASALAIFDAFMSVFGSAQQVLKNRMQDEAVQGIGPLHLRVLSFCLRNTETTQQQLVQATARDKGQIARLIRELEERHFLVRTPDERDRRVWRLSVTPEGEKKSQWFSAIETRLAMEMFGGLRDKESEQLERLLKELQKWITVVAEEE